MRICPLLHSPACKISGLGVQQLGKVLDDKIIALRELQGMKSNVWGDLKYTMDKLQEQIATLKFASYFSRFNVH